MMNGWMNGWMIGWDTYIYIYIMDVYIWDIIYNGAGMHSTGTYYVVVITPLRTSTPRGGTWPPGHAS